MGTSADQPWPFVWAIHEGGFLHVDHTSSYFRRCEGLNKRGSHVVSIANRFAPHIKFRCDVIVWMQGGGFRRCLQESLASVSARPVDIERWVAAGGSAGGALASNVGHFATPRPLAVMDVYGIVDFTQPPLAMPGAEFTYSSDIISIPDIQRAVQSPDIAGGTIWA